MKGKIHEYEAADAAGMITISEVMFDPGKGYTQWIELYNSSQTHAVNLNDWTLEITSDPTDPDVDTDDDARIKLEGGIVIPPNQTVLIVSNKGRTSGDFPATRLVSLWDVRNYRNALDMTNRKDVVLSSKAFMIKLSSPPASGSQQTVVDMAGNMGMDWALPMALQGDPRSSIIRRYVDQSAGDPVGDGTGAGDWILAADTDFSAAARITYYGNATDLGTPGYRAGGALPVSLSSFRPVRDKATGAVVIRWITQSELNNAGFNILRSETKSGEFQVVNIKGIIPGHGTTSEKHVYTWTDTTAKPNVVYYYQIEDVSLDGDRTTLRTTHLRGNVNAAGKLTTRWGELKTYGK